MRKVVRSSPNLRKSKGSKIQKERLVRSNRFTVVMNDKEKEALEAYCKKYKIESKTQLIREVVLRHIMERFLTDYPTLFEKNDLDSLVVEEPRQNVLF